MLNYIALVNKKNDLIVIDCETDIKDCNPDIGYIEECEEWITDKAEYMEENDIWFDKDKVFREIGIYKIEGYESCCSTPDGDFYSYNVTNVTKISDLGY